MVDKLFSWSKLDGLTFQEMAADILANEGYEVEDRGVGPDGGVDIIANQHVLLQENLSKTYKWIVQVKFKARKTNTVKPNEIGNIGNLLSRFKADGFLLVTNGRVTSKTFEEIRAISTDRPPHFLTNVWDNRLIEGKLLKHLSIKEKYFGSESEKQGIIVIDDDEVTLLTVSEILSQVGHIVYKAKNFDEAIKIFKEKENIKVAIIDIRLDHNKSSKESYTGLELSSRLREISPEIKIIYHSAYLASAEISARAGVENAIFLSKFDTNADKLKQVVSDTLGTPQEISIKANQFETITTYISSTLHQVVSNVHSAKMLAEVNNGYPNAKKVESLLEKTLSVLKSVMKDLALEKFQEQIGLFKEVDIGNVILEAIKTSESTHIESKVEINLTQNPIIVHCDSKSLALAFSNIIDNGLEAKENPDNDYPKLEVSSEVVVREKNYIKISIADSGIGISKAIMEHLYLPGISSKGGSGMGFFLANKIIEYNGGWIDAQSPCKEWSTIMSIYLPILITRENTISRTKKVKKEPAKRAKKTSNLKNKYNFSKLEITHKNQLSKMEKPILEKMLKVFQKQWKPSFEKLKSFILEKNIPSIREEVHYIKGSCIGIGFIRLGEMYRTMEKIADTHGNITEIDYITKLTEKEYNNSIRELKKAIKSKVN